MTIVKHSMLLLFLLAASTLVQSCKDDDSPTPLLTTSKESISATALGGTFNFMIASSQKWTISSDQGWCIVSHTEGINNATDQTLILLQIIENTDKEKRSAAITLQMVGGSNKTVIITQDGTSTALPRITSFSFKSKVNSSLLISDIECTLKDGVIHVLIPYVMESKLLIPEFSFEGEKVFIDEEEQTSGTNEVDFSSPVKYIVKNSSGSYQEYTVIVNAFTGLPMVFIDTNGIPIDSKETYVNATIKVIDDIKYARSNNSFEEISVKIRGRGNSTWVQPKKPYKLKFEEKTSLLDAPKNKDWVLLANYTDKTSLRNEVALYMGRLSSLDWTPRTSFTELFINNIYYGTYQLCEQIKIAKERVNITDDGFLLEIEHPSRIEPGDIYFQTNNFYMFIKDPDVEQNDEKYNWIMNYVLETENVLFGNNFKDAEEGYAKYLDVQSFIDWYLINEISKNNDANFQSSCYMNITPNGKLKMGPLWDFDIVFGNINYNNNQTPEGFWIKDASWISRLFQDPAFVEQVKSRFEFFKSKKDDIFNYINENANYLRNSALENNSVWKTLYTATWPNYAVWGAYDNEVQYMKLWLSKRFDWLEQAFSTL